MRFSRVQVSVEIGNGLPLEFLLVVPSVKVPDLDHIAQQCAEDKTTNVRPPRNAASLAGVGQQAQRAVEELQDEPVQGS